jgi:hypothetical protein
MRRVALIWCVWAVAAFAVGAAAFGDGPVYSFEDNSYMNACHSYPWIPHDSDPLNSHNVVTYFEDPATGPFVTEDGLVWLKKSSGTWSNGSQYELFTPNLENWTLRATVSTQTSSGWLVVDDGTFNNGGYAGYFFGGLGQVNLPSNVTLTGVDNVPHQTVPGAYGHAYPQITVTLQMWLDSGLMAGGNSPYATYAQATAASHPGSGVYVAQATFQVDVEDVTSMPMDWPNWMGMYMPAMILKEVGFPGDANGDGTVDVNDLSVVLTNYDKSGMSWSQGDFDGNGTVDINDLSKVLTNYDKMAGSSVGVRAVPEPAIGLLLAVGGLLAAVAGARKTRQ